MKAGVRTEEWLGLDEIHSKMTDLSDNQIKGNPNLTEYQKASLAITLDAQLQARYKAYMAIVAGVLGAAAGEMIFHQLPNALGMTGQNSAAQDCTLPSGNLKSNGDLREVKNYPGKEKFEEENPSLKVCATTEDSAGRTFIYVQSK